MKSQRHAAATWYSRRESPHFPAKHPHEMPVFTHFPAYSRFGSPPVAQVSLPAGSEVSSLAKVGETLSTSRPFISFFQNRGSAHCPRCTSSASSTIHDLPPVNSRDLCAFHPRQYCLSTSRPFILPTRREPLFAGGSDAKNTLTLTAFSGVNHSRNGAYVENTLSAPFSKTH